jgi:hypothetical protein
MMVVCCNVSWAEETLPLRPRHFGHPVAAMVIRSFMARFWIM